MAQPGSEKRQFFQRQPQLAGETRRLPHIALDEPAPQ